MWSIGAIRSLCKRANRICCGQRGARITSGGWTEGAVYVDPLMQGAGRAEIAGLIGAVQERFPDFRFNLLGKPDGFGSNVHFSWGLGPDGAAPPIKGTDLVTLANGRPHRVVGFLDRVAAD